MNRLTHKIIFAGVWVGLLIVPVFGVKVLLAQSVEIVSFFDSCKECVVLSRSGDTFYEYGYKINHGSWDEEHFYYGKDEVTAQGAFSDSFK